jgi:hypothetical protein
LPPPRKEDPPPRKEERPLPPPRKEDPPTRDERPLPPPRREENLGPRQGDERKPSRGDGLLGGRPAPGPDRGAQNPPDRQPPFGSQNPRIFDPPRTSSQDTRGQSQRPGQDGLLGRRGSNSYNGSVSNLNSGNTRVQSPIRIERAPIDIFKGSLSEQVLREDRVRISNRNLRTGYYHYYRNWCDDYFWFNWYVFDPYSNYQCYPSPWYYYPHLPAYVNRRCTSIVTINLSPWVGTYYQWRRPAYYDYGYGSSYSPLDYAVDDIARAFERADSRALRRLIPYRERVAIFVDGQYSYSLESQDFETFMMDAIENTRTTRYEITRVERYGREAEIQARHEYEDPWGRRTSVYHTYRLEQDRGNYVITRFGTSYYRNW